MATFVFDGTSNITAAKTDTVVITANPATFTSVADANGNSVFNFSGRTLTITGTSFGTTAASYPNVSLAGGTFSTAEASPTATTANDLIIAPTGTTTAIANGTAAGVKAIFGGVGVADPIDGADTVVIGGKGSFLVYGNGGADTINVDTGVTSATGGAFDSTSFVTVFGGKDGGTNTTGDTINFNNVNNLGAKMAIYGGEGFDSITVFNTGTGSNTTIFGGQGAADSTDAADTIAFQGGGTVNIFGNAGADQITLGGTANGSLLNASTVATIHGGRDNDTVTVTVGSTTAGVASAAKASIVVYGDEGNDGITVNNNAGTTVIYGDTAAADSAGGDDTINFSGQGTTTIYAAGGNDTVNLNGIGAATADSTSTISVFGGNGNDSITVGVQTVSGSATVGTGTISIATGSGVDSVVIGSGTSNTATQSAGTGQGITITDFTVGLNGDKLVINNNIADAPGAGTLGKFIVDGSSAQTLQQALNLAEQANGGTVGTVGIVAFQGNSYVVVHQSGTSTTAAFDPTADLAIKLTGVTDVAALSTAITVV